MSVVEMSLDEMSLDELVYEHSAAFFPVLLNLPASRHFLMAKKTV
jgi:hypothetical protein